jgi:hypothetical protein
MKLFAFIFFLIFSTLIIYGDEISGQSLLINGSAEKGVSSPDGWWNKKNPNFYLWDKKIYHSAGRSLKIFSTSYKNDFSFWAQTVNKNIPVGKTVVLKVFIKTENIEGKGVAIAIRGDDTDKPYLDAEFFSTTQGNLIISGTEDWKEYTLKSDKPIPENIKCITIYLIHLSGTKGDVYFDDIRLEVD